MLLPCEAEKMPDRFASVPSHPALLNHLIMVAQLHCIKQPWGQTNKHLGDIVCSRPSTGIWLLALCSFTRNIRFHGRIFLEYYVVQYNMMWHSYVIRCYLPVKIYSTKRCLQLRKASTSLHIQTVCIMAASVVYIYLPPVLFNRYRWEKWDVGSLMQSRRCLIYAVSISNHRICLKI